MSWYDHEREERKPKPPVEPSNTFLPQGTPSLAVRMQEYLGLRKLDYELAMWNGWYPSWYAGDGHPRIVIPATCSTLNYHYWQARAVDPGVEPRYQSPKWPRRDALVVVYPYASTHGIAVTEGPMDALVAAHCGYLGIALMGKNPSREVLDHLLLKCRERSQSVLVVGDADSPGEAANLALGLSAAGVSTQLRFPTNGAKDLAEMKVSDRMRFLRG